MFKNPRNTPLARSRHAMAFKNRVDQGSDWPERTFAKKEKGASISPYEQKKKVRLGQGVSHGHDPPHVGKTNFRCTSH